LGEEQSFLAALESLPFAYRVRTMEGEVESISSLRALGAARLAAGVHYADYFFFPADPE
jgi:hypothetical protein